MFRRASTISQALVLAALVASLGEICRGEKAEVSDAAYTKVITERADKIVAALGIADSGTTARVRGLIVQHYRSLREIHDARNAKVDDAKNSPGGDPTVASAWIKVARDSADLKLIEVHRRFVAHLLVELTPEQIDILKDAMTYGVVPITYKRYLELLPNLKEEEKREILATLREAREHAMDAGSSEEKHALFGKHKGRINNYLSSAGYDMKRAEKDLAAKEKAATLNR